MVLAEAESQPSEQLLQLSTVADATDPQSPPPPEVPVLPPYPQDVYHPQEARVSQEWELPMDLSSVPHGLPTVESEELSEADEEGRGGADGSVTPRTDLWIQFRGSARREKDFMSELDDDCDDGVDDWNPSTFNPSLSLNALDLMAEDEAIGATQALSGLTSPLDLVRSRGSRQRNALDRLSSLNTSDTGSLSRRYSLDNILGSAQQSAEQFPTEILRRDVKKMYTRRRRKKSERVAHPYQLEGDLAEDEDLVIRFLFDVARAMLTYGAPVHELEVVSFLFLRPPLPPPVRLPGRHQGF